MIAVQGLLNWICEREAIRVRRERGDPPPWTNDPILRDYRFCNVRREHDHVTKWIAKNWRTPHAADPDLFFAMVVARFINNVETLDAIGYPVPWRPQRFLDITSKRKRQGLQQFGAAYKIPCDRSGRDTAIFQTEEIFGPMWNDREKLRPNSGDTLMEFFKRLVRYQSVGGFMAAQIVADVKQVAPLNDARDWWTFAASGPGSRRGLNRVLGRAVDARWDESTWRKAARDLHKSIAPELKQLGVGRLCRQDFQNCLCELDKYERARLGEGKPKRKFVPNAEIKGRARPSSDTGFLFR